MTSHLLYKTRCPKCAESGRDRKGDNLGVYSDGHTFCFSCGHSTGSSINAKLSAKKSTTKQIPDFPEDISINLDREPQRWLLQYFEEHEFPRYLWSNQEQKLYFLLEDGAFQYRYFGNNRDHPKWVGYGINENLIHIVTPRDRTVDATSLVLVEDLISAEKVGHITPTLCLFGSNISLKRLAVLRQLGYNKVVIWLDWDKKEYAMKAAQLAQSIGLQAQVIHTIKDPKEYNAQEITEILQTK